MHLDQEVILDQVITKLTLKKVESKREIDMDLGGMINRTMIGRIDTQETE